MSFIAPGIADFLFPKAVPNEKHIPTCVPQCYDVEKILSFAFWIPVNIYFGKQ